MGFAEETTAGETAAGTVIWLKLTPLELAGITILKEQEKNTVKSRICEFLEINYRWWPGIPIRTAPGLICLAPAWPCWLVVIVLKKVVGFSWF